MSDTRDPDRDQVAPVLNDNPSCHDLVIADLAERKEFGLRKYGTPLQPFNGRSFLRDIYEELMDAVCYVRGKLEEEQQLADLVDQSTHDEGFWDTWDGKDCGCVDPVPVYSGYNFPVCMKCVGRVQDSKLAHKQ